MSWFERLQLMFAADGAQGGGLAVPEFEEQDDDDDFEIVRVGPGEEPPAQRIQQVVEEAPDPDDDLPEDVRGLSKKELFERMQDLTSKSDSVEAMRQGIADLGDKLQGQQRAQQNVPQQQPGESLAAFKERFNKELWKSKDPFSLIQQAAAQVVAPAFQELSRGTATANKRALLSDSEDGPVFKKYKKEVENLVASLPANQQNNPQVWDYALQQVKQNHSSELEEERIERIVAERLAELGHDGRGSRSEPSTRSPKADERTEPAFSESASAGRRSPKKKAFLTQEDYVIMQQKGISERDYVRVKYGR
jgi:hypothetical protein